MMNKPDHEVFHPVFAGIVAAVSLTLAACGGGDGAAPVGSPPPPGFTVGGTVSGLNGSTLRLQNNGGNNLDIAVDGTFTFTTPMTSGADYNITVAIQPNGPAQRCVVSGGSGTVTSVVTNVAVNCFDLQTVAIRRRAGGTQNDLFLVREDGANFVTLANSTDDETIGGVAAGGRVIFERASGGQNDIYSIKLDGTGLLLLANDASLGGNGTFGAGITPSGKVVLNHAGLFIVDANGANLTQLTDSGSYNGVTASGRVIFSRAVNSHDELYSVNEDGTGLATLANTTDLKEFQAITPAGRVIFTRVDGGQRDLYSVNADGTGLFALSTSPLTDVFLAVVANERVLFRLEPTPGQYDLYSVKADGTGLVTLANSADREGFSGAMTDGRVLFSRFVGGAQGDIFIVNADGTGLLALANTVDDEFFVGATRGGRIFFSRFDGSQYDLYAIDANGTGEQRVTNTPDDEFGNCGTFGCLTPNSFMTPSGRIIFERQAVGGFNVSLHSTNVDGTGEALLAADGGYLGTTASGRLVFFRSVGSQQDILSINDDGTDEQVLANTADIEVVEAVF